MSLPTENDLLKINCREIGMVSEDTVVLLCDTTEQASDLYEYLKDVHKYTVDKNNNGLYFLRVSFKNGPRISLPIGFEYEFAPIATKLKFGSVKFITAGIKTDDKIDSYEPDLSIRFGGKLN
jgi:hypothetical protein